MDFSRLERGELIAMAGGVLLAVSVFLSWYGTNPENPNSTIDGARGGLSCWEVSGILRWVLLLAAIAPFVLGWIIVRGHQLSWPRGEMTMVIGLIAVTLVLYRGLISRPGETDDVSLRYGWFVALVGALLIAVGGGIRSGESQRRRKPPGVL